jgi:hypothetical protein
MVHDWEPAERPEAVLAYASGRRLLLVALGRKPTPGSEVRITLGHEDVWPPTYYLQWRDTSAAGPSVTTGYLLVQCMEQQRSAYVTVGMPSARNGWTCDLSVPRPSMAPAPR